MPIWRIKTQFGADSAAARDRFCINPVFNDHGVTTDPQSLCDDLANALAGWVTGREIRCTAYDAQGSPPVYPQGDYTKTAGAYPASGLPRELALCLSFFNPPISNKRRRGRLYIPVALLASSISDKYATTAMMTRVAELVPILADLGSVDVDWSVYSTVNDSAVPVSDWFVNNEFDIIRSRGIKETSRQTGTVDE